MAVTQAEERVFTAYHEAGHLAAALALRVMPRGATIRPTAERLGLVIAANRRLDRPGAEGWLAHLDRLGAHARAVELMAGMAAEERAGHPKPQALAWRDRAMAYEVLFTRFGDHEVAERELARALADARQMMARSDVWPAVTLLARELLARETLWARDWRRAGFAAARVIHGRHLSRREVAGWPGSEAVAMDAAKEKAGAQGASVARHGTLAENAKWGLALVALFGLLIWATFAAQQKSEEKWREKCAERMEAYRQERLAAPAPLPPAIIWEIQESTLRAKMRELGISTSMEAPE
jgi:hypothetical protein